MDPFAILGLPRRLALPDEEVEQVVNGLLKTTHPDAGGDRARFEEVRLAAGILKSRSERMRAAMMLAGGDPSERGTVPSEVMDCFSPVAEALQETNDFVSERAKAVSGLGKAVLDVRVPGLKSKLEGLLADLQVLEGQAKGRFVEFDERGWEESLEEMGEVSRTLRFLEKWQGQLREATGKIFEALLGG